MEVTNVSYTAAEPTSAVYEAGKIVMIFWAHRLFIVMDVVHNKTTTFQCIFRG